MMQITKCFRLLNSFNVIKLNRRNLLIRNMRNEGIKINRRNNVSLTTDCPKKNVYSMGYFSCERVYSTDSELVDKVTYEKVCDETLESLCEYFEELVENAQHLKSADINYGNGVLTVNFGNPYGTYVINRQSPNRQIWLSSPKSGPKRYDFVMDGQYWMYKHDNVTLHELLQSEIKDIVQIEVDFSNCLYSLCRTSK